MESPQFLSVPHAVASDGAWFKSNQALAKLVAAHRSRLERSFLVARKIHDRMAVIFPVMDFFCTVTCPGCRQRCCSNTRVWFDFRDLIFFHLTDQLLPPNQLVYGPDNVCGYLGAAGCLLPRMSRPWACTRYLCPAQQAMINAPADEQWSRTPSALDEIHWLRLDLEDEFLKGISKTGFF